MKKRYLLLAMLTFIAAGVYFSGVSLESLTGKISQPNVNSYVTDEGNLSLYFCPREDCETAFLQFLDSAQESIHCALYDIGLESVQQKLLEKQKQIEIQIVTDSDYLKKFNYSFVKADRWGLMHDKFCIIDGKQVSTGSMNPTDNDAHKNNNNLFFINSSVLAGNYEDEFAEMWSGTFKKGGPVANPSVRLSGLPLENYFCPEDSCAAQVKEELKEAQQSILFMTFSFTHDGIANMILLKQQDGLLIRGVMETRQISEYSKFKQLQYQGIDVVKDKNKNNMHHKVFIIDGKTVITGSFNPTEGGDTRNDENLLIIHDDAIARRFTEEFEYVYAEATEES